MKNEPRLYDLTDVSNPLTVLKEIDHIASMMSADFDATDIEMVYFDIISLFRGHYPGFQASNTKYHDLEHTIAVALAAIRLMHGCFLAGIPFSHEQIFLGMCAALAHDAGLIQTVDDREGSGAKYTVGHEQRSIDFVHGYLSERHYDSQDIEDCSQMIRCTDLNVSLQQLSIRNQGIELLCKIVGSADLLAQIADRNYLEKLLLLFQEFKEAGLPDMASEFDLLKNTENFYQNVAKKRLEDDFADVARYMVNHFEQRYGVKRDLYKESIKNNLAYLRSVLAKSDDGASIRRKLRRRIKRDAVDKSYRPTTF